MQRVPSLAGHAFRDREGPSFQIVNSFHGMRIKISDGTDKSSVIGTHSKAVAPEKMAFC